MHPRGCGGTRGRAGRLSAAAVAAGEAKRYTAQQTLPWVRSGTTTPPAARPPPSAGEEISIGGDSSRRGGADGDTVATEKAGDGTMGASAPPPDEVPIGRGAATGRRPESGGDWGSHPHPPGFDHRFMFKHGYFGRRYLNHAVSEES